MIGPKLSDSSQLSSVINSFATQVSTKSSTGTTKELDVLNGKINSFMTANKTLLQQKNPEAQKSLSLLKTELLSAGTKSTACLKTSKKLDKYLISNANQNIFSKILSGVTKFAKAGEVLLGGSSSNFIQKQALGSAGQIARNQKEIQPLMAKMHQHLDKMRQDPSKEKILSRFENYVQNNFLSRGNSNNLTEDKICTRIFNSIQNLKDTPEFKDPLAKKLMEEFEDLVSVIKNEPIQSRSEPEAKPSAAFEGLSAKLNDLDIFGGKADLEKFVADLQAKSPKASSEFLYRAISDQIGELDKKILSNDKTWEKHVNSNPFFGKTDEGKTLAKSMEGPAKLRSGLKELESAFVPFMSRANIFASNVASNSTENSDFKAITIGLGLNNSANQTMEKARENIDRMKGFSDNKINKLAVSRQQVYNSYVALQSYPGQASQLHVLNQSIAALDNEIKGEMGRKALLEEFETFLER